ncbi:MAG: 50S ribosomal protein L32 [Chloroflexota bacterium]
MGALPKKKISSSRRGQRRSHDHIQPLPLGACGQCGTMKPTHRVCPTCGTYNGHQILKIKTKTVAE